MSDEPPSRPWRLGRRALPRLRSALELDTLPSAILITPTGTRSRTRTRTRGRGRCRLVALGSGADR